MTTTKALPVRNPYDAKMRGLPDAQAIRLDSGENPPGAVPHGRHGWNYDAGASALNNRRRARELREAVAQPPEWVTGQPGIKQYAANALLAAARPVVGAVMHMAARVHDFQAAGWEKKAGPEGMAATRQTYGTADEGRSNGVR